MLCDQACVNNNIYVISKKREMDQDTCREDVEPSERKIITLNQNGICFKRAFAHFRMSQRRKTTDTRTQLNDNSSAFKSE